MTTPPLLTRPDSPAPSLAHLWATVLDEIRRDPDVSPANFSTWLRETQLLEPAERPLLESPDGTEYVVGAPHAFARDRLARALRPAIERALARCLQRPAVRVRFAVAGARSPAAPEATAAPAPPEADASPAALPHAGAGSGGSALNPRATFERYIAGRGSEFAVAAARAVAENPALAYNPLYLYGEPGTGKTHLLHAIGNRFLQRRPGALVLYRSLADGGAFVPAAPGLALLLLDDAQGAPGSTGSTGSTGPADGAPSGSPSGASLTALLAALQEASTQVVVAGDRPPRELTALDGRLRAWLQMGLVAGIGAPDFETRLALVRQRAQALGASLPPAVLEVIARRAPADARELEGLVTRVFAAGELSGLPLTPEHVSALLAGVLGPARLPARRRASAEEVLLATGATFGVPVGELKGRRRDKEVVLPRQVAMYLLRHETGASLAEIGAVLGGRDHSTVIHGCERVATALESDPRLRELVAAARQLFSAAAAP
ncbi:MAG TPA: DnaA/Hda family protein [Chloroflexota bacterium]|nr:DnaA/Hda family protein [Chloroflexota bacterium]